MAQTALLVLSPIVMSTAFASEFVRTLAARGYIHQITDPEGLDQAAAAGALMGYIGFDMTAPSLHVGNLVQIMLLRRLQQAGGKPIALLGGATTKIGDPSGKDESRKMLTPEMIANNMANIRGVFEKLLVFGEGPSDAVLLNNEDWLSRFGYIEFLREFGPHFTINRMLTFDSVKLRLEREQPLTFLEFNYMLMQAVDFLHLYRSHGVRLQMGGSDQWGNIVNGVELTRRVAEAQVFGLTTPLITTASGAKMGKTAAGAVWLNEDMLSPYEYWQFWRNTEDSDVGRFLRLFTDLPLSEIARLEALQGAEINDAKKALANAATEMLHGAQAANEAEKAARITFEQGGRAEGLPTIEIPREEAIGMKIIAAFTRAGLTESNGEAKRHVKAGALKVNDTLISDDNAAMTEEDFIDSVAKLSLGKKKHALLKLA